MLQMKGFIISCGSKVKSSAPDIPRGSLLIYKKVPYRKALSQLEIERDQATTKKKEGIYESTQLTCVRSNVASNSILNAIQPVHCPYALHCTGCIALKILQMVFFSYFLSFFKEQFNTKGLTKITIARKTTEIKELGQGFMFRTRFCRISLPVCADALSRPGSKAYICMRSEK